MPVSYLLGMYQASMLGVESTQEFPFVHVP